MSGTIDAPAEYSTPGLHPTLPGADWFIDGARFNETGRTTTADGTEHVHLRIVIQA